MPRMTLPTGSRVGVYEILALLGAGGMGEVYRARDSRLGREVAIKILTSELSTDTDRLRRFEREARAVSLLNHPNIMAIYDIGVHDGVPYIICELLEGQNLREKLHAGPLPLAKAIDYSKQVALGLAQAHKKGIVHRDLKPENLFVLRDGRIKILDFGLAKLQEPVASGIAEEMLPTETQAGVILGSIGYMAPEQVLGQETDYRVDIFNLGAILYETLCGKPAFVRKSVVETMNAILKEDPYPLSDQVPDVPPMVNRIIEHCLQKDPAERFQSAQDLAFDLDLSSAASQMKVSVSQSSAKRISRQSVLLLLILSLGSLVLGAIVGRFLWKPKPLPASMIRVNRLTEFIGLEEFPSLSHDARSVVFSSIVDGKRQLWVRLIAGGPALQITRDSSDHLYPRWSRDSSSLIYFSPPAENAETGSLWEVSTLGDTPRRIGDSLSGADINRTDDRIAFFRLNGRNPELILAKRDGSKPQVITSLEPGYEYTTLRWSPDGRSLAYKRSYQGLQAVFVTETDKFAPKQIVPGGNDVIRGFTWLPDSTGIVYSSTRARTLPYLPAFQLWQVQIRDGSPRQITFGESSYVDPDLTTSGVLVATRINMRSNLWRFPIDGDGLQNVARATQVTQDTAEVRTPFVSPDGKEVVFVSDATGHSNLWIIRIETGEKRQLTFERDPNTVIGVPLWSPDGQHIAFYWLDNTKFGYSIIRPDGSGLRQILTTGWWVCWSHDGRSLYYQDQKGRQLKKIPITGGEPETVREDIASTPALSPDGKTLYFATEVLLTSGGFDHEIRSASPESGPSRLLTRIPSHRMPESPSAAQHVVSPDGKWLALPLIDGAATNVWAIATSDGTLRRFTDFGNRPIFIARRVSWSPDGRFLYAAVSEGESDIVMLNGIRF
jgi:eukaryotic-like serine/threonine-protein kinase